MAAPDLAVQDMDLESSHDKNGNNNDNASDPLKQKQYPSINKAPQPPPVSANDNNNSNYSNANNASNSNNSAAETQSTASSIMSWVSSATKSAGQGMKALGTTSYERLSLEGQLRQARISLQKFVNPKVMNKEIESDKTIPKWVLKGAKGIVFLTVVKAGFVFAGSAGTGIVIVRTKDGRWSGPSSIGVAGVSAGFLAGASKVDYIMILPNEHAVAQFSGKGQFRLGGEFQLAIGPLGRDASGSMGAGDKGFSVIYSYSQAVGLYGGLGLDGKVISVRPKCNNEFYRQHTDCEDILNGTIDPKNIANEDYAKLTHLLDAYCVDDDEVVMHGNDDEKAQLNPKNKNKNKKNRNNIIFGVDAYKLPSKSMDRYKSEIPIVLITLKKALFDNKAHLEVGVFRTAPSKSKCDLIENELENGKLNALDYSKIDNAIIANLIKIFFRELPHCVLEDIDLDKMECCKTVSDAEKIVNEYVKEPNLSYFGWLLDLALETAKHVDFNKMSNKNMATVFAPNCYDLSSIDNAMKSMYISTALISFFELCMEYRKDELCLMKGTVYSNDGSLNNEVVQKPAVDL